jgi:Na+/melibiose symporter-like transporter
MSRRSLPARLRRRYGASPWHLAGHLVVLAVAAFALDRIASAGSLPEVVALYIALIVGHDLVLLPAYSGLDRLARTMLARRRPPATARVPVINHLRAPALISALLLVIYAPLISGRADRGYLLTSGHPATGYLRNWLLITAALFVGSGLIYAIRRWRARG